MNHLTAAFCVINMMFAAMWAYTHHWGMFVLNGVCAVICFLAIED